MLPNISRSKDNRTVRFGQLIDYNMRTIFLEKLYAKCGGETSPTLFFKKSKLRISLDQQSKVLCSFFFFCPCRVCNVINFEVNFSFLVKPFSHLTEKVRTKV